MHDDRPGSRPQCLRPANLVRGPSRKVDQGGDLEEDLDDARAYSADLDLFVYLDGALADLSASGSADEQVTLLDPADGTYDVYVNGFATRGGSTSYGISNFVVPPASAGNAFGSPKPGSGHGGPALARPASASV